MYTVRNWTTWRFIFILDYCSLIFSVSAFLMLFFMSDCNFTPLNASTWDADFWCLVKVEFRKCVQPVEKGLFCLIERQGWHFILPFSTKSQTYFSNHSSQNPQGFGFFFSGVPDSSSSLESDAFLFLLDDPDEKNASFVLEPLLVYTLDWYSFRRQLYLIRRLYKTLKVKNLTQSMSSYPPHSTFSFVLKFILCLLKETLMSSETNMVWDIFDLTSGCVLGDAMKCN